MAGTIIKAAIRLLATTIATFAFLAAQPQGIAAYSGVIAGGDSDSAMTGTGPTSPQPAAKIPGSGNGPVAPTRGGTGTGGGTKGGTKSGGTGGTNTSDTTATGGDNTPTGTATTGDTGTVSGGVTTGDTNPGVTASADDDTANDATDDGDNDTGSTVLGVQNRPGSGQTGTDVGTQAGSQQGGAVAGLQSLPGTSTPAGSPIGAVVALAGALYAVTRRMRS